MFSRKKMTPRGIAQSQQSRNVEQKGPRGGGHGRRLMSAGLFSATVFIPQKGWSEPVSALGTLV